MSARKIRMGAAAACIGLLSLAAGAIAQERYGEINQAEASLNAALGQLHAAREVFGGHKAAAERLIREAIGELRAAKADAAAHGR